MFDPDYSSFFTITGPLLTSIIIKTKVLLLGHRWLLPISCLDPFGFLTPKYFLIIWLFYFFFILSILMKIIQERCCVQLIGYWCFYLYLYEYVVVSLLGFNTTGRASSLKQQSARRHVAPLGYIIPILSQPVFAQKP